MTDSSYQVEDEVVVFDGSSGRIRRWPGKITNVGRKLLVIEYQTGSFASTDVFRMDTRKKNDKYGSIWFRTAEEVESLIERLPGTLFVNMGLNTEGRSPKLTSLWSCWRRLSTFLCDTPRGLRAKVRLNCQKEKERIVYEKGDKVLVFNTDKRLPQRIPGTIDKVGRKLVYDFL